MVSAQRDLMSTVFAGGGDKEAKQGRYNILLMGGDAGRDRVGLRPDSMTVASVDAETGRTVLISLPRNLEDVPFPESSPLHKKFPNGYSCPDHSCMLNAIYTYATTHKNLYPGVSEPGRAGDQGGHRGRDRAADQLLGADRPARASRPWSTPSAASPWTSTVGCRSAAASAKLYGYVEAGKNRHLDRPRGAVVRPVPLGLLRLRPDRPAEVRDERHAQPAGPGHGADQVQQDRRARASRWWPPTSPPPTSTR